MFIYLNNYQSCYLLCGVIGTYATRHREWKCSLSSFSDLQQILPYKKQLDFKLAEQ